MSTLLYGQSNNYSAMKISLNGILFNRKSKYSSISRRAKEVSVAGIFCLLIPMMFTFFCVAKEILLDSFGLYANIMISSGMMFRVIALDWVNNLISKQNGSRMIWKITTFLFPSITLIVLGEAARRQPSIFETAQSEKISSEKAAVVEYVYEISEQPLRKAI